ncbi:MAG: transaldolase [Nitrospinaceae bacterium]|nr:transaldolase [Nitrospinaceae bacterium]MBT5368212.1 transaldolase [Nitrospinaceae bacterium]MBT6395760.1 transaldolase [Nitrospinaceae bacterium]
MEIFLDSANAAQIGHWVRQGILDGVTTNPSIMLKDGVKDLEKGARDIMNLLGDRPLSVEVTTNDPAEMIEQGREYAKWGSSIVVKIPIINEDGVSCLEVIKTLSDEGVKINTTAILSFNQVLLAAKAGATYLSIFAGRVADEGHDSDALITMAAKWVEKWGYGKILIGSIRGTIDVQNAAVAGAHIITVPPPILEKMTDHKFTRETVRMFNADAKAALLEMEV